MKEEYITLSEKEIKRLRIIHKVMDREVTQIEASGILGISDRQIRNIIAKVKEKGDKSIAHGNRGRAAPNRMAKELEDRIGEIVERKYADFKPSFASEKLLERHGIRVGREKLRQIMILKGLWRVRRGKKEVREHFVGEIVLRFNGRNLKYREITEEKKRERRKKKEAREPTKKKGKYIPPPDHPWKRHTPSLHHNWYLEKI